MMILYNIFVVVMAPLLALKWLLQKKYRGTCLQRLGFFSFEDKIKKRGTRIWIHMVSMGETRAMVPIYRDLSIRYPGAHFFLSSTTATGQMEAKKIFPGAEAHFFLPLDLPWVMKRLARQIAPHLLVLSEGDFWANQLQSVKKRGGKVLVFNGKISERSVRGFKKVPLFTNHLFGWVDHFSLQSEEHRSRFASLGVPLKKLSVVGNIKLAIPLPTLSEKEKKQWQSHFGLLPDEPVITLGSTHPGEEELLIRSLPHLKILIVPRHPERFASVKKWIDSIGDPRLILVDKMGILPICYQLSCCAIVGGSFIAGVGGHNIFEPVQAHIPVLFGPYMEGQKELVKIILEGGAGAMVSADQLMDQLQLILSNQDHWRRKAASLSKQGKESLDATWQKVERYLPTVDGGNCQ